MARSRQPEPKAPDWPPEKSLRVLRQQLESLGKLRERRFREAENEEREWEQLTAAVLTHAFGEESGAVRNFHNASSAGQYRIGGVSEGQLHRNFELRLERYETVAKTCIRELELSLPECELKGAYEPGEEYSFYRDLKSIVAGSATEVFITDTYLSPEVFDIYVEQIPAGVRIRILTSNSPPGSVVSIAKKFAARGNFELRSGKDAHDRVVFVDQRCWIIGQSIKDAARTKPTYIVEFDGDRMKPIYEDLWNAATILVSS